MSKNTKTAEPVTEIGQIPFALCEIVAALEQCGQKEQAAVAESIVDLLLGLPSLNLLAVPPEVRSQIVQIIQESLAHTEERQLALA